MTTKMVTLGDFLTESMFDKCVALYPDRARIRGSPASSDGGMMM